MCLLVKHGLFMDGCMVMIVPSGICNKTKFSITYNQYSKGLDILLTFTGLVAKITTTLNTIFIVGHTIFSTLYSVDKLDEQWMKNG